MVLQGLMDHLVHLECQENQDQLVVMVLQEQTVLMVLQE